MNIIKRFLSKDPLCIMADYMSIALHVLLMTGLVWLCKWSLTVIFN